MESMLKDAQSALTVSEAVFGHDFNEMLVHQIVVAYAAGARQDIRAQRTRAEIIGSDKKPRHQKGTGCARSGLTKNPIWRPGGVASVTRPQNHNQKVNRKMCRGVPKSILSGLVRQDRLIVVGKLSAEAPKTKLLAQELKDMTLGDVLIITGELDGNLFLAARSLHKVGVCDANGIDPVSLITFDKVVIIAGVVKQVEEMLA